MDGRGAHARLDSVIAHEYQQHHSRCSATDDLAPCCPPKRKGFQAPHTAYMDTVGSTVGVQVTLRTLTLLVTAVSGWILFLVVVVSHRESPSLGSGGGVTSDGRREGPPLLELEQAMRAAWEGDTLQSVGLAARARIHELIPFWLKDSGSREFRVNGWRFWIERSPSRPPLDESSIVTLDTWVGGQANSTIYWTVRGVPER